MVSERLRVELERSGGFGGITTRRVLDSAQLPPGETRELERLVEDADLDALEGERAPAQGDRGMPDSFQYRLSVLRGGRRWDVEISDPDVPASLRALLTHVLAQRSRT
jgi:hypothetical protein